MGYATVTLTYPGGQTPDPHQCPASPLSKHRRDSVWQEEVPASDGGTGKRKKAADRSLWWSSAQTEQTGHTRGRNSHLLSGGTQRDHATTPREPMRTLSPAGSMRGPSYPQDGRPGHL